MSIFDTIAQAESGFRNIVSGTAGSTASGIYQINNPTWRQFAPQAGVDLSQYPTALSAPTDVQTQVASVIPLARWVDFAPATAGAVARDFGQGLDPNATLGTINAQTGGIMGDPVTGGTQTAFNLPGLFQDVPITGPGGVKLPSAGDALGVPGGTSAVPGAVAGAAFDLEGWVIRIAIVVLGMGLVFVGASFFRSGEIVSMASGAAQGAAKPFARAARGGGTG